MALVTFPVTVTRQSDGTFQAQLIVSGTTFVVVGAAMQEVRSRLISKVQGYFTTLEAQRVKELVDLHRTFTIEIEVYDFDVTPPVFVPTLTMGVPSPSSIMAGGS